MKSIQTLTVILLIVHVVCSITTIVPAMDENWPSNFPVFFIVILGFGLFTYIVPSKAFHKALFYGGIILGIGGGIVMWQVMGDIPAGPETVFISPGIAYGVALALLLKPKERE